MNNIVTIVALSVDTRHAVLYLQDGSTLTFNQGDARLPRIVEQSKDLLARNLPAQVDITPVAVQRTEFSDAEKGTNGAIRFFRVAKAMLKKLINTESPVAVPAEVAHISPLEVGVFPGAKEKDEVPQEAVPDTTADTFRKNWEEFKRAEENATTSPTPAALTNDQKLEAARERMQQLVGNSHGTDKAEFHTPLDEKTETIVAVHTETGAIIPDAHKLARQLRASQKLESYAGFQKFIERLSAIIDQRGHSVEDLMKFIEHGDLPIADDGCIVIYKRLNNRGDHFVDVHTGNVKQKVGSYVFMKPGLVDPNRRKDCSNGLHVASLSYIRSFSGDVTVMAKVRPEDVFAVPEYDTTKMRVCGYHVLVDLPEKLRNLVNAGGSISADPDGAKLLANVLRGNHVSITQHVEIGGDQGTNITYTDVAGAVSADQLPAMQLGTAQTLDMEEALEPEAPKAPDVKAQDLVQPKAEDGIEQDSEEDDGVEDEHSNRCTECGDRNDDGEGFDGLCGNCADKATAPEQESNESSIETIMSNDPKETSGDETKPGHKLSQKEKAAHLYEMMASSMDKEACRRAALQLSDFRRSARKSWTALGLPERVQAEVNDAMGVKPAPVNAPKAAKPQSTPKAGGNTLSEEGVANVLAALKEGLSQRAVAEKFGLSKDQVYRLVKKHSV
jgi:hypothetical protein